MLLGVFLAKIMFGLHDLPPTLTFDTSDRRTLLWKTLQEENGKITSVKSIPGHVSIFLEDGKRVVTFGIGYGNIQEGAVLDLNSTNQGQGHHVLDVLNCNRTPGREYVVYKDGQLEVWNFNSENGWKREVSQVLVSKEKMADIAAVDISNHNTLYWYNRENSSVYETELSTKDPEGQVSCWAPREILTGCPDCELICVGNITIIWPRQPYPPGLYFTWNQETSTLKVYINGHGIIAEEKYAVRPCNVKKLLLKLSSLWSKAVPSLYKKALTADDQHVYFVDKDANVYIFDAISEDLNLVCTLQLSEPFICEDNTIVLGNHFIYKHEKDIR